MRFFNSSKSNKVQKEENDRISNISTEDEYLNEYRKVLSGNYKFSILLNSNNLRREKLDGLITCLIVHVHA